MKKNIDIYKTASVEKVSNRINHHVLNHILLVQEIL
jgi:hypothetical protein